MNELIKSSFLTFEKSKYTFELLRHSNGENYIEIIQQSNSQEFNSIKIREKNCLDFINHFNKFLFDTKISVPLYDSLVSYEVEQKIITNYLKGSSIKDLVLLTQLKESEIVQILTKNNIEIIKLGDFKKKFRKRK